MAELSPLIETPIFLLSRDESAPVRITHLFDADGNEVGTWEEADRFVAGPCANGKWIAAPCADFKTTDLH